MRPGTDQTDNLIVVEGAGADDAATSAHCQDTVPGTAAARHRNTSRDMHGGGVTWPALEALLQGRPGWRRIGREWHGPCPLSGDGRDTAWFAPGDVDAIRAGCRHCGGRLDGHALAAHLEGIGALAGAASRRRPAAWRPRARPEPRPAGPLPAALWALSGPVSSTPGAVYLAGRLGPSALPASVRWVDASAAARLPATPDGDRVRLPAGAAGALVYRFGVPADGRAVAAVQLEPVDGDGRRVPWVRRDGASIKRKGAPGSSFTAATGRRVFAAVRGRDGAGMWVCEGPPDALAVAVLAGLGVVDLAGAAVVGVDGTAGLQPGAVLRFAGLVTVATQDDGPGVRAALALARTLRRLGRRVRIRRPSEGRTGRDWADAARAEAGERAAIGEGV